MWPFAAAAKHGGGSRWRQRSLKVAGFFCPSAVLMISGHWETEAFAVMSAPQPPMVYDYSGFPPETFEITYPAPGAPVACEGPAGADTPAAQSAV